MTERDDLIRQAARELERMNFGTFGDGYIGEKQITPVLTRYFGEQPARCANPQCDGVHVTHTQWRPDGKGHVPTPPVAARQTNAPSDDCCIDYVAHANQEPQDGSDLFIRCDKHTRRERLAEGYYDRIAAQTDAPSPDDSFHASRSTGTEESPYAAFGRAIIDWARDPQEFFFSLEASEDICEIAQSHGLVQFVAYDPTKHGEIDDVDAGDMVWIWTEPTAPSTYAATAQKQKGTTR